MPGKWGARAGRAPPLDPPMFLDLHCISGSETRVKVLKYSQSIPDSFHNDSCTFNGKTFAQSLEKTQMKRPVPNVVVPLRDSVSFPSAVTFPFKFIVSLYASPTVVSGISSSAISTICCVSPTPCKTRQESRGAFDTVVNCALIDTINDYFEHFERHKCV